MQATNVGEVQALTTGYFLPRARRRLVVVLTDLESTPFDETRLVAALRRARTGLVVVRFWKGSERVFDAKGKPERYRPDPVSGTTARRLAAAGAAVAGEDRLDRAAAAARRMLGDGPTAVAPPERRFVSLAPWAVLAACLPLAFVIARCGGFGPRQAASARRTAATTSSPAPSTSGFPAWRRRSAPTISSPSRETTTSAPGTYAQPSPQTSGHAASPGPPHSATE